MLAPLASDHLYMYIIIFNPEWIHVLITDIHYMGITVYCTEYLWY
jgi:hypothetical protein